MNEIWTNSIWLQAKKIKRPSEYSAENIWFSQLSNTHTQQIITCFIWFLSMMINSIILLGWHVIYFIFLKYKTVNSILEAKCPKKCISCDTIKKRCSPKFHNEIAVDVLWLCFFYLFSLFRIPIHFSMLQHRFEFFVRCCCFVRIVVLYWTYLIRHRWTLIESVIVGERKKTRACFHVTFAESALRQ